jgi:hypothetical protein
MLVSELIKALQSVDEDRVVVFARIPDENNYGEVMSASECYYDGEECIVQASEVGDEDVESEGLIPAIVLWQ